MSRYPDCGLFYRHLGTPICRLVVISRAGGEGWKCHPAGGRSDEVERSAGEDDVFGVAAKAVGHRNGTVIEDQRSAVCLREEAVRLNLRRLIGRWNRIEMIGNPIERNSWLVVLGIEEVFEVMRIRAGRCQRQAYGAGNAGTCSALCDAIPNSCPPLSGGQAQICNISDERWSFANGQPTGDKFVGPLCLYSPSAQAPLVASG